MNPCNSEQDPVIYEEAFSSFSKRSLNRLRKQPYILLPGVMAYLRGLYYKVKFKLLFKHVRIGRHFRVYGKLVITGPGKVIFGDDCFVMSQVIKTVRIRTLLPQSEVAIGNHVGLNGSSIVCSNKINIDDFSNIADAYITDTPAHPISIDRRLYSPLDIPAESVSWSAEIHQVRDQRSGGIRSVDIRQKRTLARRRSKIVTIEFILIPAENTGRVQQRYGVDFGNNFNLCGIAAQYGKRATELRHRRTLAATLRPDQLLMRCEGHIETGIAASFRPGFQCCPALRNAETGGALDRGTRDR